MIETADDVRHALDKGGPDAVAYTIGFLSAGEPKVREALLDAVSAACKKTHRYSSAQYGSHHHHWHPNIGDAP